MHKKTYFLLQAAAVWGLSLPVALLPFQTGRGIGLLLGTVAYRILSERRRIAIENIRRVQQAGFLPAEINPEQLALKCFQNLGLSVIEIIKIYHNRGDTILNSVQIRGRQHLEDALKKNKGAILISGHCGNWELLALTASYRIRPLKVVARALDNPVLNRIVERARQRYGNTVIYKKGAIKEIMMTLKNNGMVGILIDQSVVPSEGVLIDFLGSPAWTLKAPVLIARKTGAPVLPVFIKRKENTHVIEIHPEIDITQYLYSENIVPALAVLNSYVENYIINNPSEWLWIHRRWKKRA